MQAKYFCKSSQAASGVILTKSQLPKIKAVKQCAIKQMAVEYQRATGTVLTATNEKA